MDNTWDLTPAQAIAQQHILRLRIRIEPLSQPPNLIAGVDVSLNRFSTTVYAGWVVMRYDTLEIIERAFVQREVTFPYISGLLSYREVPPLIEAWNQLTQKPDLALVDGAGIAHPRRIGIASHLGLVLDIPTIGCAKSRLVGVYDEPAAEAFSYTPLYTSSIHSERIGSVVRTKTRVNPLFISPGHRTSFEDSVELVRATLRGYRLPEPTRQAHLYVNEMRIAANLREKTTYK